MKICQNCGVEVSDTARFCRRCGARLEPTPAVEEPAEVTPEEPLDVATDADVVMDTAEEPTVIIPDAAPEDIAAFEDAQEGIAAEDQPLEDQPLQEDAAKEFEGTDYSWGPPTGGENYDEPAMPAVFVGGAEEEAAPEPEEPYTYRLEGPTWDHTDEFDEKDISDNKVTAMAAYLLGPLGVIIALLAGQNSPFAEFHMRQGLKFVVVESLLSIIAVLLCWTVIVPVAAAILCIILGVVKIIAFVSVCKGRAVEPPIIRSLGFLR